MSTITGTTPYPWPFDGILDAGRTALVICGCDPASASRVPSSPLEEGNLVALRRHLTVLGVLVVVVRHDIQRRHRDMGVTPSTGTASAAPITAEVGDVAVLAAGIDGFYGSVLDAMLQRNQRTHLLLGGLGLETTVHSTMRRANDRGYECLLVADATVAGDPALRQSAVSQVEMSGGIFGAVATTANVLAAFATATPPTPTRSSR